MIVGADGRQGARDLRFRTWLRSGTSDVEVRVDLLFEHPSKPRRRVASTPDEVFADAGP